MTGVTGCDGFSHTLYEAFLTSPAIGRDGLAQSQPVTEKTAAEIGASRARSRAGARVRPTTRRRCPGKPGPERRDTLGCGPMARCRTCRRVVPLVQAGGRLCRHSPRPGPAPTWGRAWNGPSSADALRLLAEWRAGRPV